MGKVFDALQRAEQQRTRRAEGGLGTIPALSEARPVARGSRGRLHSWRRWLTFRRRSAAEDASAANKTRIALLRPQSFVAEQFRTLRARLEALAAGRVLRTLAVTSASSGDGKTMSAVNLALVVAMSVGRKVVLVDCDLRRPRVHECLGLAVDAGLAEVLSGSAGLEEALVGVEGSALQVLAVRALPANPAELLASNAMLDLMEKLATRFDWVILDVPPILGLPDAKVVSGLCDGILFVVRAHVTPREEIEAALDVLDRSRVLGIVLNESDTNASNYGMSD